MPKPVERGALAAFLSRLTDSGVLAASAWIGDPRGAFSRAASGMTRPRAGESVDPGTRFDIASLTKPFTATLALALDQTGELPLATRLGDLRPVPHTRAARCTLEALLRHRSGLIAWAPLETISPRRSEVLERLLQADLWRSSAPVYSDLGYILWALNAERALGRSFADLLREHVLEPLGIAAADSGRGVDPVATSPLPRVRERELARALGLALSRDAGPPTGGRPQDGNARFLGGLAGHAGLFANADAVAALACEWLAPSRILARASRDRALAGPAGDYALGWARRRVRGSAGPTLSSRSFGHTGFTGGSVWADPERRVCAVLLAHRRALDGDMNPWRREFHRLAVALGHPPRTRRQPPVAPLSS